MFLGAAGAFRLWCDLFLKNFSSVGKHLKQSGARDAGLHIDCLYRLALVPLPAVVGLPSMRYSSLRPVYLSNADLFRWDPGVLCWIRGRVGREPDAGNCERSVPDCALDRWQRPDYRKCLVEEDEII